MQPCIREVPFGASVTAFNTFEEMSNNTASIKALLQQMIIETSLMLTQPLCNETIVSLMANQGEDPPAAFNNLPGRHSDHFCIKLSKNMFVVCVFDLGFRHCNVCSQKKYTKRSSNTLLHLVYFFSEQTLLSLQAVWIFGGQSTVPPLYSSLLLIMSYSFRAKQIMIIV